MGYIWHNLHIKIKRERFIERRARDRGCSSICINQDQGTAALASPHRLVRTKEDVDIPHAQDSRVRYRFVRETSYGV